MLPLHCSPKIGLIFQTAIALQHTALNSTMPVKKDSGSASHLQHSNECIIIPANRQEWCTYMWEIKGNNICWGGGDVTAKGVSVRCWVLLIGIMRAHARDHGWLWSWCWHYVITCQRPWLSVVFVLALCNHMPETMAGCGLGAGICIHMPGAIAGCACCREISGMRS